MIHVKYEIDYSFRIDSNQVFYHVKYLIWGLVRSILLGSIWNQTPLGRDYPALEMFNKLILSKCTFQGLPRHQYLQLLKWLGLELCPIPLDVHISTTHWRHQMSPPTSQISYCDLSLSELGLNLHKNYARTHAYLAVPPSTFFLSFPDTVSHQVI